ncbi:MAG: ATP-binding protein, partial [Solirubrobacterales bacterium]
SDGREDLFAAWRLFFERLADQLPVVMVFEDMQWADTALMDFIEYLLEWSRSFPIFVMTLARPELHERRPTWGAGERSFTSLYLEPLSPERMRDLLSGLVVGLPEETIARILQRSAGVPLYAVETVRMLLDRGLLVQDGPVYRPTGPIETLEIPETLHALIAARLDGLAPAERSLVQNASVLGKTFFKSGLVSVSGLGTDELEPILAGLTRKEILSLQADPRSPERGQYAFLQDVLRTVAYETLSKRERKAKHLAAAAFLEEAFEDEDEVAEVVSSHYLAAYEAAPEADDAPRIRVRARELLAKAGEHAASLAAPAEALRYFEQAIGLTDEGLALAGLHERGGAMARRAGDPTRALEHYEAAIDLFRSIGQSHSAARVSAALAEVVWMRGDIEGALEQMERAFDVLVNEEEDADLATLAAQMGRLSYFMGRTDEALERLELALTLAETLRLPDVLSEGLNTRGMILATRGRTEEGTLLLRHALTVALEHGLSQAALRAINNVAAFDSQADRYASVIDLAAQGLELARRVGDRLWEQSFLIAPLEELTYLGRWDEVAAALEAMPPLEGLPTTIRLNAWSAVPMLVLRGELDRARGLLESFPEAATSKDVQAWMAAHRLEAMLLLAEGHTVESLATAEEIFTMQEGFGERAPEFREGLIRAMEAASALGDRAKLEELLARVDALRPGEITPHLRAQGARFAAHLAALRGDTDAVEIGFHTAIAAFGALSMPFHVAMVQLELGEWLVSQGRDGEVAPLLDEAGGVFERLGARPSLDRLRRVAENLGSSAARSPAPA